jgi:hypothetical protein
VTDHYPGYDVLAKRSGQSWNAVTREVVEARIAMPERDHVLDEERLALLRAVVDRLAPQPEDRPPVNTVALLLEKLAGEEGDGYRHAGLPPLKQAWMRGLDAIEAEAVLRYGRSFTALCVDERDSLLQAVADGAVQGEAWAHLPPAVFFYWRLLPDTVAAYWSHPSAWSAMGFGGPASPRGYVRLGANQRDPWEAAETGDGALLPPRVRNRHVR